MTVGTAMHTGSICVRCAAAVLHEVPQLQKECRESSHNLPRVRTAAVQTRFHLNWHRSCVWASSLTKRSLVLCFTMCRVTLRWCWNSAHLVLSRRMGVYAVVIRQAARGGVARDVNTFRLHLTAPRLDLRKTHWCETGNNTGR